MTVYVVKVGMRREPGEHNFDLVRFVLGDKALRKMQSEYPWPLVILRTFERITEQDLVRIKNRWLVSKVEGKDDWYYAFPSLGVWLERINEDDIKILPYPKIN